jgi:hypothetical protein
MFQVKQWFLRNFICRFVGHRGAVKMPLFVAWKGVYDDDPYWDNLKSQTEENRRRSIPVCQHPGPGGICRLKMFHDGSHEFYPEWGVATALNEPLDYSTPSLFFVESTAHGRNDWYMDQWLKRRTTKERGSIHCERCGTMIGEY